MLALLQAPLPVLPFVERWSVARRVPGFWGGFRETAPAGGKLLYVEGTARGQGAYAALDLATGKPLWRVPTRLETIDLLTATPHYGVLSGEHRVLVFDARNGKPVWQGFRQTFGAGPLIVGDRLFAELKQNVLTALDLPSGRLAWRKAFPARVQTKTGFDRLTAVGDSLWATDARGTVSRIAQKDGRTLWSKPFTGGEVTAFVPTRDAVVRCGTQATEALRPADGARLWRTTTASDYSPGFYRSSTNELWRVTNGGSLSRFDARDGRLLGQGPARFPNTGPTFDSVPYRGGLLVLGSGPVVLLDAQGRQTGSFDPQEVIHELFAVGDDLVLDSVDRLVRFAPGTPPPPKDPTALAARLVAKPTLTPDDRRTLIALGHAAVPALLDALPKATGDRRNDLGKLLYELAGPSDTPRIFALADATGLFGASDDASNPYVRWLLEKGDADVLALALLPRLRAAPGGEALGRLAAFSLRSTAAPVVDELLARLKAPETPEGIKALIYGGIAASGRAAVLDEILKIRSEGRRLTKPIPSLPADKDSDGDGLPDAIDANPFVAPHPLTEEQRALLALFDVRFRYDARTAKIGLVDYGPGVVPFELVGWKGGLVPRDQAKARGFVQKVPSRRYPFALLRFEPQGETGHAVAFNADRTEATASLGATYGGLDGLGYEAKLRKMRGEWFVVSLRMTWIS